MKLWPPSPECVKFPTLGDDCVVRRSQRAGSVTPAKGFGWPEAVVQCGFKQCLIVISIPNPLRKLILRKFIKLTKLTSALAAYLTLNFP